MASSTSWVTITIVQPVRFHTVSRKSCIRAPGLGVEGAERLVEQQHVGLRGQRPGDGDPLAHAARQLPGQAVGVLAEVHDPEQLVDPLPALGLGHLASSRPNAMFAATVSHGNSE